MGTELIQTSNLTRHFERHDPSAMHEDEQDQRPEGGIGPEQPMGGSSPSGLASAGYQIDSEGYQALDGALEGDSAALDRDPRFPEEGLVIPPAPAPAPQGEFDAWGFPIAPRAARNAELDPPRGWMPEASELASVGGSDSRDAGRKQRQVNVRLEMREYRALQAAAELYGARPTTFARMLINRGAQATLAAHRAEFSQNPTD